MDTSPSQSPVSVMGVNGPTVIRAIKIVKCDQPLMGLIPFLLMTTGQLPSRPTTTPNSAPAMPLSQPAAIDGCTAGTDSVAFDASGRRRLAGSCPPDGAYSWYPRANAPRTPIRLLRRPSDAPQVLPRFPCRRPRAVDSPSCRRVRGARRRFPFPLDGALYDNRHRNPARDRSRTVHGFIEPCVINVSAAEQAIV